MNDFILSYIGYNQATMLAIYRVTDPKGPTKPKFKVSAQGDLTTMEAHQSFVGLRTVHGRTLAQCSTCGHYDCRHAMFVQQRIRHHTKSRDV